MTTVPCDLQPSEFREGFATRFYLQRHLLPCLRKLKCQSRLVAENPLKVVDGIITWPSNSIVAKGGYIAAKKKPQSLTGAYSYSALSKCTA